MVYDPRRAEQPATELDQITTHLTIAPPSTQDAQAGWYTIAPKMQRPPVFEGNAAGRFNLDTATVDLAGLKLMMTVSRAQDHLLPGALQKLLVDHQVTGRLDVAAKGILPLGERRQ